MVDAAEARQELGWASLLKHEEALRWTVAWHQAEVAEAGAGELRAMMARQIRDYCILGRGA
jgi:hypothetical protein